MDEAAALERIRKLLAQAEGDGVTKEESETYRNAAFEMAARWRIDHAKLIASGQAPAEAVVNRIIEVGKPFLQMMLLANAVFRSNDCTLIKLGTEKFHAFGYDTDMTKAEILFTSLIVQAERWVAYDYRASGKRDRRPTFRRAFYAEYGRVIHDRLQMSKRTAEEYNGTPGTDIVLRSRMAGAEGAMQNSYPQVRKGRRTKGDHKSYGGRAAGRQRGRQADIGSTKLSTGETKGIGR